ncbi:unnamed protein product [Rotaria sp. Silwood1]|nr:unnamed protein product [Rotaria sp. Silwood1]
MDDIENIIEQETKINNVEPTIAEEIHEERIEKENQDEDILLKENLTNETIANVHTFLFDILAFFSNFQSSLIVEYCQETQNWNSIQHFLNDENTHILPIFFCDPQERFRSSKRSSISKYLSCATTKKKAYLIYIVLPQLNQSIKTDESYIGIGIDKSFEDGGVIFIKPNTIKLTERNFKNELVIFSMNFDQQNLDLMINLETILFSYLPSIKKADEWNKLYLFNRKTDQIKLNLIYQIEQNAIFFRTIHKSFIDCIQLQKVPIRLRHDTQEIINPNSLLRFVQDTELVQQTEETIIEWIKEIDNFYRKSTLVRQIMSDSGPLNEIKYWRKQVIQLNHLINQLRLPSNRAVIYLLNIAASPRSIEWREIDKKLTLCINEARDHYKFLMIVAKHIGPLYRNDPREIQENLNNLLNTIVLINSCSEFYSKPEKIAGLLVSINNQMVISCKNYLTNNHTIDIRILDRKELLKRIDYIHNLYQTYHEIFIKIKQKIENHYLNKTNDHLSEHHLFGQLDFLSQRLTSFREIIESFEIYSLLSKSRMDGLEQITSIYNKIQTEFYTFKFNLFDSNDKQFDLFYNKLHHTLSDIDVDNTLSIGLNRLNWLSKNFDELFLPAEEKISLMSDFLSQISSLIIHRIEEPLNEVSRFEILEFPDDSIDFKQFINDIRQQIIFKAEKLNSLSMQIESAVLHVIQMFFDKIGYKSKPFEQKIGDIDLMQLSSMQRLAIQMFVQDPSKSIKKSRNPNQFILQPSNEWERFNELCNEFLSSFEARLIEALTLCAKNTFEMIKTRANPTLIQIKSRLKKLRLYSLDTVDANIDRKDNIIHPLILTNVELHSSIIILNPSIDEIQQLMHQLVNYVLNIFHGVRKWGEVRHIDCKLIHNYPMHDFSDLLPTDENLEIDKITDNTDENLRHIEQAKTYYNTISNNKELTKLYQNIGTFFVENHVRFEKELEEYYEFRDLWEMNKINQAKKFILANPSYAAIRSIFSDFDDTRDLIKRISESKDIDPFRYITNKLKTNLFDEIRQLELIFAKYIRIHYRMKFMSINDFFKKTEPRLNRQLRDLDDVRFVINALDTLKENFVFVDHTIEPLEEVYNLFKRYSIDIPQEEQMAIEMLRSTHERLLKRAKYVTHDLVNTQQSFLDRFLIDIKQFQTDVTDFVEDYDNNGPMIEGLPAQEASDRLTHFESRFNDLWKRYETFLAGEELFGLDKTEYIHLQTIKKQLNYLKRLYGLYNDVINTMEIYYETNWKDFHIDQITNEIQEFQNKMKKLPKGLKTWPAYSELKKKLDNFNECLPLLELLINPAMQSRHWERIEKLAKIHIPHNDSSIFSLKHVMNVPLIKYREDIEDISITAQKERDIESKLFSIEHEWRQREFKFTSFKNRGELLLRGQETSEILSAIDDSNLILAALASNRYNIFFKNQIQKYIADLAICAEILTKWMQVQNLWIYLGKRETNIYLNRKV